VAALAFGWIGDEQEKSGSIAQEESIMEGPLRGCLAGVAAWKWGGGCLSTIVIFIIVYLLLGHVKC